MTIFVQSQYNLFSYDSVPAGMSENCPSKSSWLEVDPIDAKKKHHILKQGHPTRKL